MYPRLKEFRESLKMTQAEFGESIGIAKSTYNNYETGVRDPKSDFWIAVAKRYGVTIDYLMGYSDNPHQVSDASTDKVTQPLSPEAVRLAQDYDKRMDNWGRKQVRTVADNEVARYSGTNHTVSQEQDAVYFICPGFLSTMSAGTGQQVGEEYPENYRLVKEPPRGTSYIAPVSGNSMEPTYHDGDKLFIRACTEIRPGQIGVFFMDGQQWVKELGDSELISHNPEYAPIPMREGIRCQGLVLGVCDKTYLA